MFNNMLNMVHGFGAKVEVTLDVTFHYLFISYDPKGNLTYQHLSGFITRTMTTATTGHNRPQLCTIHQTEEKTTMSSSTDGTTDTTCANCGKGDSEENKLKRCTACKMVKYCCRDCQVAHRPRHKRACKKRAAELFDAELFSDPPERKECPICMLPLPLDYNRYFFKACCGQIICNGCAYAQEKEDIKSGKRGDDVAACPFCRTPTPSTDEDANLLLKKFVDNNNTHALFILAENYGYGKMGYPIDSSKAIELFLKAGELGHAVAYYTLGCIYKDGKMVEKDLKRAKQYFELGAIAGCVHSRHYLACLESVAYNNEKAVKHLMISAKAGLEESLKLLLEFLKSGLVTKDEYTEALRAYQKEQEDRKSAMRDEVLLYKTNPSLYEKL